MITRLMLVYLSLLFSLAEPEPGHKCEFPGDCLTHDTTRKDQQCEMKSDRWQRYQNASPEDREQMRKRWREPMRDRIIRIYEVDASQENEILDEVESIYVDHSVGMIAVFEEAKQLDEAISTFTVSFTTQMSEDERGDTMETSKTVLRQLQDDPEYQRLVNRRQKIEASCQIDWDDSLKRIEKLLPEVQVLKGRGQLAIELPHRCCKLWTENARANMNQQTDSVEAVHPWEAHVLRFIERYRLNVGQIGAARSILREVRQQATQVDRWRFEVLAEDHRRQDNSALRTHIEDFELRTDDLFDELNMRLDALLTTTQRQAAVNAEQEDAPLAE